MAKENQREKEKLFSERIDRLVAGGELKPDDSAGNEFNEALDIARKMVASTPKPGAAFEARLRTELLQKLVEKEIKEESWVSKLFQRQPVWQAVSAIAVILIMVGAVVIWSRSTQFPSVPTVPTAPSAPTALTAPSAPSTPVIVSNIMKAEAETNKTAYAPGETVEIEVALENVTSEPLEMEQFPPILSVMDAQTRQPVFTFKAGEDSRTLLPGEAATFVISWNQRDETGLPVTGDYYLELEDVNSGSQAIKLTFTRPVNFSIADAEIKIGTVYRTINLNQTQTVNGITVALQVLELADKGARLTAVISAPPDYTQNRFTKSYAAFAVYYLDMGWVNNAGLSSVEYGRVDMKHTWFFTEPIPEGTQEMVFVIMTIGDLEGPWQFTIPFGK